MDILYWREKHVFTDTEGNSECANVRSNSATVVSGEHSPIRCRESRLLISKQHFLTFTLSTNVLFVRHKLTPCTQIKIVRSTFFLTSRIMICIVLRTGHVVCGFNCNRTQGNTVPHLHFMAKSVISTLHCYNPHNH